MSEPAGVAAMRIHRTLLLGVFLLALGGCQATRIIERPTPLEISRLEPGDTVGVLLVDGSRHDLTVTEASATHLTGAEDGRTLAVPVEAIEEIRHQKRTTRASTRNALQRALAAIAASLALATGDQDTVNAPAD